MLRSPDPSRRGHSGTSGTFFAGLALCLVALSLAGCEETQAPLNPGPEETEFGGDYDPFRGVLEFRLESTNGAESSLRLIASEIQWAPGSGILRAQVALHNVGLENVPGPDGVEVFDFVPPEIFPLNAICPQPPTPLPQFRCIFNHRETYGDDGILAPGETSLPVEWQFQNLEGVSFAFRARLLTPPAVEGAISGVVFEDLNRNGLREANEPGIAGFGIGLDLDDFVLIRTTDANGRYAFDLDEPGLYRLRMTVPDGWIATTPIELHVLIVVGPDGELSTFSRADFGCVRVGVATYDVTGTVFHDRNRNGRWDMEEEGMPSVEIRADGLLCFGPIGASTRSDSAGTYLLRGTDIRCGLPWFVQREMLPGWIGTTPTHVLLSRPPEDGRTFQVDFGLAEPDSSAPRVWLTIAGRVFDDLNRNGIFDPHEPPIAGAEVQLVSLCDVLRLTWTDARGMYRFEHYETRVCPVTHVWLSSPEFMEYTSPNPFPLASLQQPGFHSIRVDFGVRSED